MNPPGRRILLPHSSYFPEIFNCSWGGYISDQARIKYEQLGYLRGVLGIGQVWECSNKLRLRPMERRCPGVHKESLQGLNVNIVIPLAWYRTWSQAETQSLAKKCKRLSSRTRLLRMPFPRISYTEGRCWPIISRNGHEGVVVRIYEVALSQKWTTTVCMPRLVFASIPRKLVHSHHGTLFLARLKPSFMWPWWGMIPKEGVPARGLIRS